jgi:hypothetical protein
VSLAFVAILGFCGRRPLLGPFIAAFLYGPLKTLPFFRDPGVIKYLGVAFGVAAILVAVAPGFNLSRLTSGKRASERDGGNSPVDERTVSQSKPSKPIQPVRRPSSLIAPATASAGAAGPNGSRSSRSKVKVGADSGGTRT